MPNQQLDLVFATLADPTRRAIVERLAEGPAPVKELARPHDMALPSFLQHVRVLEQGRMIRTEKVGRQRICRLDPLALAPVQTWLDRQRRNWERRLDRLAQVAAQAERDGT